MPSVSGDMDSTVALAEAASLGFLEGTALAIHRASVPIPLFLEKPGEALAGILRLHPAALPRGTGLRAEGFPVGSVCSRVSDSSQLTTRIIMSKIGRSLAPLLCSCKIDTSNQT